MCNFLFLLLLGIISIIPQGIPTVKHIKLQYFLLNSYSIHDPNNYGLLNENSLPKNSNNNKIQVHYENLKLLLTHMKSLNRDKKVLIDSFIAQGIKPDKGLSIHLTPELTDSMHVIDQRFNEDLSNAYKIFQNIESKSLEIPEYLITAKHALEQIVTVETQNLLYFLTPEHAILYTDTTNNTTTSRFVNSVVLTYVSDIIDDRINNLKTHYTKLLRLIDSTNYSDFEDQKIIPELQADTRRLYYLAKWNLCFFVLRNDEDFKTNFLESINTLLTYARAMEEEYPNIWRVVSSTEVDYLALIGDKKVELPLSYALRLTNLLIKFDKATVKNDVDTREEVLDSLRELSSFKPVRKALQESRAYEVLGLNLQK